MERDVDGAGSRGQVASNFNRRSWFLGFVGGGGGLVFFHVIQWLAIGLDRRDLAEVGTCILRGGCRSQGATQLQGLHS